MTGSGTMNWLRQGEMGLQPCSQLQFMLEYPIFQEITGCNDKALKFFLSAFTTVMSLTVLVTWAFQHFISMAQCLQ